jgi:hypothetical protein
MNAGDDDLLAVAEHFDFLVWRPWLGAEIDHDLGKGRVDAKGDGAFRVATNTESVWPFSS